MLHYLMLALLCVLQFNCVRADALLLIAILFLSLSLFFLLSLIDCVRSPSQSSLTSFMHISIICLHSRDRSHHHYLFPRIRRSIAMLSAIISLLFAFDVESKPDFATSPFVMIHRPSIIDPERDSDARVRCGKPAAQPKP